MPRTNRIYSSTGIYHITMRSVNQHIIFEEEFDYQKFLFILSDCKKKHEIDIYAYCLMGNHIHLLLHSEPEHLAHFFEALGSRYVRWYNNKYLRSGHLFQGRFHSTVIENRAHYLTALQYIHNNPVKANICRYPSEYPWSSYQAFYGKNNPLLNLTFSYAVAGSKDLLQSYFAVNDGNYDDSIFAGDHRQASHYPTEEQALSIFYEISGLSSVWEASNLPRKRRNDYILALKERNLTIKQIARIMDVSQATVKRVCAWKK